ncbi:ABC transporter permease [Nitrospirillum amazonense]|uniref:ABC transporter permease n=1 Tax=Nitrospirillum amazonense TaxID=28077 RepID=UPI002412DED5|nr:ABC transporter permease [Nitrospirillum amazonense]MDG3438937.1 ABC transporter permease [Nitrospirillum amazonense]
MLYIAASQAMRSLRQVKADIVISLAGLVVGLTASLLMALLIRDQMAYDTFLPDHAQLYLVDSVLAPVDEDQEPGPLVRWRTPPDLAATLVAEAPEVEAAARLLDDARKVRHGGAAFREFVTWVDPAFADIMRLPAVEGDLKESLADPGAVALTQTMARKLFGPESPLGKRIELDERTTLRVRAVLKDLPFRSHMREVMILASAASPYSPFSAPQSRIDGSRTDGDQTAARTTGDVYTYVRLRDGADPVAAQRTLDELAARHWGAGHAGGQSPQLVPMTSLQLHAGLNPDRLNRMYMIGGIALLTLLIPCINFINMATARATRRAVEVGVRKMGGARRRDLVIQFMLETLILVGIAMVIALSLTELAIPPANRFLDARLSLDAASPEVAAIVAGLGAGVTLLAGFYPALVLAAHRPVAILKGGGPGTAAPVVDRTARVRQVLMMGQFMLLVMLLVGASVTYRQQQLLTRDRVSYDTADILILDANCPESIRVGLQHIDGVKGVGCTGMESLERSRPLVTATLNNGHAVRLNRVAADPGFLPVFHLPALAGQLPDPKRPSTVRHKVVINETASRALDNDTPEDAIGQALHLPGVDGDVQVAAVVPDFPMGSLQDKIAPTFFVSDPGGYELMYVKLSPGDRTRTLAAIDALWRRMGELSPSDRYFFDDHLNSLTSLIRHETQMITLFSLINLGMACAGIYGLSAVTAERRTKEIGVRKVYGASLADILRLLLWQFAKPVLVASALAWLPAYLFLHRWLAGFAYHVDIGPWTFLGPTALALAIAAATVAGQTILIARARPVLALRYE